MDISGAFVTAVISVVMVLVVVGLIVALVFISRWARANPSVTYEMEDPETGVSEKDWSDSIK